MNEQSQMMNQAQIMSAMSQAPPPPPMMMMMNQIGQPSQLPMMMPNQSPMMGRGYKVWPQQQQQPPPPMMKPNYANRNNNWKGKKGNNDKRSDSSYKPPTLHELQFQNRLKARKFYPKKKFNNRFAPYAPRNTTSFIIRAKKSGGIASLVSPCPVTPAVLPTPIFSPSREVLGDMAKEEWGVDGYGSMKGLIRLRSPGNDDEEDEEAGGGGTGGGGGSSESDVEEHVEVERRLDHDLSRFEMVYPNYSGTEYNNVLENRVDDQDSHIAQLEEENLTLKERLFLMEREMGDLRRRLLFLERHSRIAGEIHEEVVENESENDNESEGGSGAPGTSGRKNNNNNNNNNNEEVGEFMSSGQEGIKSVDTDTKEQRSGGGAGDACMEDSELPRNVVVPEENGTSKVGKDETGDDDEKIEAANAGSIKEGEARTSL